MSRPIHLCPGSGRVASANLTGPGRHECLDCHQFPAMVNGRILPHPRSIDRHTPYDDDGVTYCGWTTEVGVFDGCGRMWPCGGES